MEWDGKGLDDEDWLGIGWKGFEWNKLEKKQMGQDRMERD